MFTGIRHGRQASFASVSTPVGGIFKIPAFFTEKRERQRRYSA